MNAPAREQPQRYIVSWHETRAYSADLQLTLEQLAEWAIDNLPLHALHNQEARAPRVAELTSSLSRNAHLLSRLAQQYARARDLAQVEADMVDQPEISHLEQLHNPPQKDERSSRGKLPKQQNIHPYLERNKGNHDNHSN